MNNLIKLLVTAALFVVHFSLIVSAAANDNTDFWIGILRKDGLLTPVAHYHDGNWSTPWPSELSDKQLDISIKSVFGETAARNNTANVYTAPVSKIPREWLGTSKTVPVKWYLYNSDNQTTALSATKVKLHESHCSSMWSLVTDYSEKEFVDYWPKPKAGFIASSSINMNLMRKIDVNSVVAKKLTELLKPNLKKLERDEIGRLARKYGSTDRLQYTGHPVSEVERDKVDYLIRDIYGTTTPISGEHLYYVNLSKQYDKPITHRDAGCKAISWFGAWISSSDKNSKVLNANVNINDCDMKGADVSKPNTVILLNNKYYLISENYGYEWEYYTVDLLENGKFKTVVNVGGGGC